MTNPNFVPRPPANPFPFRLEFPPELPISARAEEITTALQNNPVLILAGETGSGKTTQIPKLCLAAGRGTQGRIACTQPRRVAALSVSRRVAEELDVPWGRQVGCKVRFDDRTSRDTVIKFLTDGMLLAEVQGDPLLREYDTIIIDEAHERSLNIDFLLGHLRTLRYKRPELKIVITSATIDTAAFSAAFDDAPVIQVEGRTFPVEVIYAPLDQLGRDYSENDENSDEADPSAEASAKAEALHYIDGCVEAVARILRESTSGDVLVFLPSERDIRELTDLLESEIKNPKSKIDVVPLFGRLSNAEQQRVFAPTPHRKIVLATNIAETSLTIPGIRFVVDTGLARISRYSPQARTRRLPIEPIAQSSADQRKGRAGRVADGVCIRLYSESDYLDRPRFTQPEIQRANLADVILRLKAFGLGDIERFPFINMPAAKSIRAGYALLEELGALTSASDLSTLNPQPSTPAPRDLTPIGRELARLPVDPTVGRMILQARHERALREVLIIAAGLSIQDPRERPLDKQAQADAAHRRFRHPDSDFLTLLNIWETYHDEFENLSQAKLRRFCRDHFLSYTRMREWRDIHAQLLETLRDRDDFRLTSVTQNSEPGTPNAEIAWNTPAYRAIHRSILAGLLGNIAHYDEQSRLYKATHDRRVTVFPGSALHQREAPNKKALGSGLSAKSSTSPRRTPRWIIASEIVETSRLYARTCARLDPAWALELGAHIVRISHSEPFWNVDAGRVMVKQRTRLYGLELETRSVGYGKINPVHATEIFIREGLVADTVTFPLDFITHNRQVRENVEALLTRTRDAGYLNLDEALYNFYAHHLLPEIENPNSKIENPISSVPELIDLVRHRRTTDPDFLKLKPEDLHNPDTTSADATSYPAALPLENRAIPLNYVYKPGQPDDGVTLDIPLRDAATLRQADLDFAVPGHLEQKVEHYLRALPKELRRAFVPLAETAKSLTAQIAQRDRLTARRESLTEALAFQISERFRVAIDPAAWADKPLPEHLRVRVRVTDDRGREIVASRNLAEIRAALDALAAGKSTDTPAPHSRPQKSIPTEPPFWRQARAKYEKPASTSWTFGDLPDRLTIAENAGVPVHAFPALTIEPSGVALRLFKTAEEATAQTPPALSRLLELNLGRDLAWLERDLRSLRSLGALISTLAPLDQLQAYAFTSLRRWLTDPTRVRPSLPPIPATAFTTALTTAKSDLRGVIPRLTDLLREILTLRQSLLVHPQPYPHLDRDLATLLPADFLARIPYPQLQHVPRYLRAMKLRADRWRQNPAKDADRAAQLAPYVAAVAKLPASPATSFRWLVEEFRVSLFAQELGTAEPVSTAKLDRALASLSNKSPVSEKPSAPPPRPIVTAPLSPQKTTPLKSLTALDKLFPR
jgi:ATP-dependent helicase HrpA